MLRLLSYPACNEQVLIRMMFERKNCLETGNLFVSSNCYANSYYEMVRTARPRAGLFLQRMETKTEL